MLSCPIVLHLLSTEAAVYNYKLILTKRGGVRFFLTLFTPSGTMYLEMSAGFVIYGPLCFWQVSISVHVQHRIPDAEQHTHGWPLSAACFTPQISPLPCRFQGNFRQIQ